MDKETSDLIERVEGECPYGGPVISVEELDTLDEAEIIEGYRDGYANEPRPSGNRSKAYWHGWRNGMVDGKHAEPDDAQAILVRRVVAASLKARLNTEGEG